MLSQAASIIHRYYSKYTDQKGTQFVFCDLGTYKPDAWNIYTALKEKLVESYHIPPSEIRFIQEAKHTHQRQALIESFKKGDIRILVGHTKSLGTGVDAPNKVVAIHNLDIPWTPKDLEQRAGRGARKGNEVARLYADNRVDNYMYAAENSLDTYKFNLLQNKQVFITQLKTNSLGTRLIDEGGMDEEGGINYAEYTAILSGNTDLLDRVKLDGKIAALESEHKSTNKQKKQTQWNLDCAQGAFSQKQSQLQALQADLQLLEEKRVLAQDKDKTRGRVNPNPNPLELSNFNRNDSLEAIGKQLIRIKETVDTAGEYQAIGKLFDFTILVKTSYVDAKAYNRFFVAGTAGTLKYSYNNGVLANDPLLAASNFIKALDKLPALLQKMLPEVQKLAQDIQTMHEIVQTPWRKHAQLKELKAEREVLDKKIQASLQKMDEQQITAPEQTDTEDTINLTDEENKFIPVSKNLAVELCV